MFHIIDEGNQNSALSSCLRLALGQRFIDNNSPLIDFLRGRGSVTGILSRVDVRYSVPSMDSLDHAGI